MDFTRRHSTQIITNTPSLSSRMLRTSAPSVIDSGSQNLSAEVTQDRSFLNYTGDFIAPLVSSGAELWSKISYSITDVDTGAKSKSFYTTSGIDFVVRSGLVLGALLQLDVSQETGERREVLLPVPHTVTSDLESTGWLVGPYVVHERGDLSIIGQGCVGWF